MFFLEDFATRFERGFRAKARSLAKNARVIA
jgi:hypothetical protein